MSDDKAQETQSEAAAATSPDNPGDTSSTEGSGEASAKPKREWKPTPKFDYSKVAKNSTPKAAPKEPEPDVLVISDRKEETEFPYGVAAVFALLLLIGVYVASSGGHGHGDAHAAAHHEKAPVAAATHTASHQGEAKAEPRKADLQPQPRANARTRPAPPKPAAEPAKPAEPAAEPAKPAEPAAEPAKPAEPAAEPAKPAAEPAKPAAEPAKPAAEPAKPAAGGGLAAAQAELDARHWFAAYRAGKDEWEANKTPEALEIAGLAACQTKKADKVKWVLKRLKGSGADNVKKKCKSLGVATP